MNEELVRKAKKGDTESFSCLIEQVKEQAYRVAYCYLHNEEDSMDAVCDGVEKAYHHLRKLKEDRYFKTWFIRIVINECKQQLRRKQKIVHIADQLYATESFHMRREEKLDLEGLLNNLPMVERTLIYMKYYMGYTLAEIADIMELPEGTVKSKIYHNLKKMKLQLELKEG